MKILYTGPFGDGSLTELRRQACEDLGHEVVGLDQDLYTHRVRGFLKRIQHHSLIGPNIRAYGRDLVRLGQQHQPDLVYVDQAAYLRRPQVQALRDTGARIVHFTSESLTAQPYWYRHFFNSIDLYDAHVVTFPVTRDSLLERGAKEVLFTEFGFDPDLHRPPVLSDEERKKYECDAVFVGHWETSTEAMIRALRDAGLDVRVWGPTWERARSLPDRREIRAIYGRDYVKVLGAAKICLCFLSKRLGNRWSVSRTFEIPAVGGFLLAERTEDHLRYYREGEEAEFFDTPEELVRKARHYLQNPEERRTIAERGRRRCLSSGYTHKDRMRDVLDRLVALFPELSKTASKETR
jgi:spore maturation protein CgeB